ncbi:MAG: GNAT family N-acetyltransferase [Anaerolineae bacterium]
MAKGKLVFLRDHLPSDVDHYIRWQFSGEWRSFDAPWQENRFSTMTPEEVEAYRERSRASGQREPDFPRKMAIITTVEGKPLGWVNRYAKEDYPGVWYVGIDICEDDYLGRGFGTEALGLWIDYLFLHSEVHRIGLDSWSFNPRMRRAAEKLGLVYEGAERELREWQGQRLDLVHYGLLRREWVERRGGDR